jgi:hypothetical protein
MDRTDRQQGSERIFFMKLAFAKSLNYCCRWTQREYMPSRSYDKDTETRVLVHFSPHAGAIQPRRVIGGYFASVIRFVSTVPPTESV